MRFPRRPSRLAIRNQLAGLDALANGATPAFEKSVTRAAPKQRPKRQQESKVNETGKAWAKARSGVLYRNAKGLAGYLPPNMPVGIGPNGTGDLIGPMTVRITPEMVGRLVAVYAEFESKTPVGVLEDHQRDRITWLKDIGAICGCCRDAGDYEDAYQRWLRGQ